MTGDDEVGDRHYYHCHWSMRSNDALHQAMTNYSVKKDDETRNPLRSDRALPQSQDTDRDLH
jgi:hypothetical protein